MKPVQTADAAISTALGPTRRGGARGAGRRAGVALVMGGVLLLGAACSSGGPAAKDDASGGAPASAAPKTSAAVVTVSAKDGATNVAPSGFQVTVASGKLTTVEMTDKNGKAVEGQIAADGLSWKPGSALAVGTVYTVNAQAKDSAGLVSAATSSFTTLSPAKTAAATDNIADNGTYGVGMIVSVNFNKPIKNKDDVVKNITFETSDGSTVKGHWFGSQRLDFRPEKYWKPDTKVTVHYRLKNVEVAPGVYGDVDRDEPFRIGRERISTADAATHQMTVQQGGSTVKTIPITAGNDDNPSWNGTMVISGKEKVTRMNSATVSNVKGSEYDISDVPHAMRLTTSGTYVHGNYWGSSFGKANASHGCISMQDAKGGDDSSTAGKFFADSIVGDVVKVVNSKGKTVQPDNGLSGWNVSWANW
ncbi:L,D-transpeptidase [Saccharothrix sp. ST-888]|uniref:L,D-transpeptidase n=1 Tax=Saccharothrix sp. ST-888 TaxID=1427391 RepID=UPI0009E24FA2|nr:Ig-like domain-containing protein [Saccharothrix sp. ST-888]